ncbi:SH3 domain-containing protein [Candidatus Liberibacter americanus]|uniref:SH3b domain-containing protein n=1 Tax=Candidatus Liberibacter americanus str. Sao Paulo TaxID=1261131 RepID=U6B3P4_9HYPH|nr:SH3 domain-containing protein [Candidatus Liberibacter americanus]AHA27565.1 hypothetical protein lam_191 [Candidatus Liberibacter americanus str. Sao Paulo]EMS36474.1 hypothetical protein G653_00912 [Candidatus Liberibacter americanus PW_SP]
MLKLPQISHNLFAFILALCWVMTSDPILSNDKHISKFHSVPRFVTIKSNRTNVRFGPGTGYAVSRIYLQKGFPVEIIQEYEDWRKIRDLYGNYGWIKKVLLSMKRSAIISPWTRKSRDITYINLYNKPDIESIIVAKIEPGALLKIRECSGIWCFIENSEVRGWIKQSKIWGVYPNEIFK